MSTPSFAPTPETTLRQHPERAAFDHAFVHAVFDEALYCHVGFVADGRPFVMPTIHARVGETLYLHGAGASRLMQAIASGEDICITATLLDGLVLARSWFAHSMNYRSVVAFGRGRLVTDLVEKARALRAIVEHVAAGRSREARPPTPKEMQATAVVAFTIERASGKSRRGLPKDQAADYELPVWAGELPLGQIVLPPVADPRVPEGVVVPASVTGYRRPGAQSGRARVRLNGTIAEETVAPAGVDG
jgi:nitroimidazol reductase NimA-like FMN-containing flavoprotein (pyridoxamine 5'-phosphate oxidase superfamily)